MPQSLNYRAGHYRVANIQLDNFGNRSYRLHIVIMQSVTGMYPQADTRGMTSRDTHAFKLFFGGIPCMLRIGSRMQLNHRRTGFCGSIELVRIWVDK